MGARDAWLAARLNAHRRPPGLKRAARGALEWRQSRERRASSSANLGARGRRLARA